MRTPPVLVLLTIRVDQHAVVVPHLAMAVRELDADGAARQVMGRAHGSRGCAIFGPGRDRDRGTRALENRAPRDVIPGGGSAREPRPDQAVVGPMEFYPPIGPGDAGLVSHEVVGAP